MFTAEEVRAILDGKKTQLRRLVKHRGELVPTNRPIVMGVYPSGQLGWFAEWRHEYGARRALDCPCGAPGDRLWAREEWRTEERAADLVDGIRFATDGAFVPIANMLAAAERWVDAHRNGVHGSSWRPARRMPRWASRITLELSSVRVERLQELSEEDARAEGVEPLMMRSIDDYPAWMRPGMRETPPHVAAYRQLWEHANGKLAPWTSNPWIWVVGFRRVEGAR